MNGLLMHLNNVHLYRLNSPLIESAGGLYSESLSEKEDMFKQKNGKLLKWCV